jgi:nicotinamidase-related amidase
LLGQPDDVHEIRKGDAGLAADQVDHAAMAAPEPKIAQNPIGLGGERAIGEIEQLDTPGQFLVAQEPASVTLSAAELRPGSESYELHPEIVRGAGDITVVKHQSSPLHPGAVTGLHEILEERAIETVIITGLVTNGCCDCTARDAFQYGYNVFIATDATAAMTDAEHNGALLNLAIYYAEPVTTNAIEQAAKSAGG